MQWWSIILLLFSVPGRLTNETPSLITQRGYHGSQEVTKIQSQQDGIEADEWDSSYQKADQMCVLLNGEKLEIQDFELIVPESSHKLEKRGGPKKQELFDVTKECPKCEGECLSRCSRNFDSPTRVGASDSDFDHSTKRGKKPTNRRMARRRVSTPKAKKLPPWYCFLCVFFVTCSVETIKTINNCCCCCCPDWEWKKD